MRQFIYWLAVIGCLVLWSSAQAQHESDVIPTSQGDLTITFLGHGSLMFEHLGKVLYVDPFSRVADYSALPKADVILITHDHGDHLDTDAIAAVRTPLTAVAASPACRGKIKGANIINVNRTKNIGG